MAIQTDKLAPRILVNENDIESKANKRLKKPITLMFGFAPIGRTCEMVVCNNANDILTEFGSPESAPEKYFIDSALRLVGTGATALMTRLPYDNDQSHTVKYVDFKVGSPISMRDIATVPMETKTRKTDDRAVTVLKEMHNLDKHMTQVQRISQVYDDYGDRIHSMTNEELIELELDPQDNLKQDTFRIVDIRGQKYGIGAGKLAYSGIFPVITTAPMALYYQSKILNTVEMDSTMAMMDVSDGIEMNTYWYKHADPIDDETKELQAEIVASIETEINFNTEKNRFHRNDSFEDACVKKFPNIGLAAKGKLERIHLTDIGVLICGIQWDADQQKTNLVVLESYVGKLSGRGSVDREINSKSKLVRMYKNVSVPVETDFFVTNDQKIASLGMDNLECQKYSDVDSLELDVILDAGLSATAFAAYVAKNDEGETFEENDKVRTKIDWSKGEYPPEEYVEKYAKVWNQLTRLFGDFIKSTRGDCVYIADGPRILNLERNYPIKNYTDMENVEMFNQFLPFFNGYTNNYVARYWNWVYIEDLQWTNRGLWVPGSVVMGSQLSVNDKDGEVWYAPAGQNRGLVDSAFDVSVKTKTYNSENDLLYSNQWNFFNIYQNEGVVVEGQKTLQTKKTALDRLNVRRLVCYIKQQARIIANRYKYEPHTKAVREGFVKEIMAMLQEIQKTSGISDYRVICDETNNTIETIDRHELWCKIAVKPIKAIEYIVIDLDIINGKVGVNDGNSVVLKS